MIFLIKITKSDKGIMAHGMTGYEGAFNGGLPPLNYETMMALQNQANQQNQNNQDNPNY